MEEKIDFAKVPYQYSMCLNRQCPQAGTCLRQLTEQSVPENAAFCDDITKHVQQVEQLHVASGTTDCTPDDTETAAYHYDTVYGNLRESTL